MPTKIQYLKSHREEHNALTSHKICGRHVLEGEGIVAPNGFVAHAALECHIRYGVAVGERHRGCCDQASNFLEFHTVWLGSLPHREPSRGIRQSPLQRLLKVQRTSSDSISALRSWRGKDSSKFNAPVCDKRLDF